MNGEELLRRRDVRETVSAALREDIGTGDVTSIALVPADRLARAVILARSACTVAGGVVAAAVCREVDERLRVAAAAPDGARVSAGQTVLTLEGPARAILTAERTALNFMQRLSGIATLTRRFVDRVSAHGTMILDTRKTTPGLRALEKYAVVCGGGVNHRFGLYDRVLIKDNHRNLWAGGGTRSLADAVEESRRRFPALRVEIEVESLEELADALRARPDWVLLDNMAPEMMSEAVRSARGIAKTEASGGITLENVDAVAATGVDAISLGCLTHSAPSVDLSLEMSA